MNTMIIIILLSLGSIILLNVKENKYHLSELILILVSTVIYSLPKLNGALFLTEEYDYYIVILLIFSFVLSIVCKSKLNIQEKCLETIKVLFPLIILMFDIINFDLRIIISILVYLGMNNKNDQRPVFFVLAYLIISCFALSYFVTKQVNMDALLVNYTILDFKKMMSCLISLLTFINVTIVTSDWFERKRDLLFDIFWPVLLILSLLNILSYELSAYNLIFIGLATIFFWIYRSRLAIILLVFPVIALVFIHPIYFCTGLIILLLISYRDYYLKIIECNNIKINMIIDLACVASTVFVLKSNIPVMGIVSILMFIAALKTMSMGLKNE